MPILQDAIHKLEVGGGSRIFRIGLAILAIATFGVVYNWRCFKNMSTQEAMDAAQLGRNIAAGKGYTTLFIRPLSVYLIKRRALQQAGGVPADRITDLGMLKGMHPDIANPPVYPLVLAGLQKVAHFDYAASNTKPWWSDNGKFWRYKPDFMIGIFNQVIFLGVIVLIFFLARRLFDAAVAWLSAGLLLGCELMWRFSTSGLSTMVLLLIFSLLIWCLVLLEEEIREPKRGRFGSLFYAFGLGIVLALGCLTRYSFGWVLIPLLGYLIFFGGAQRIVLAVIVFAAFGGIMAPWVIRNYHLCGAPFGTAGYAILQNTEFMFAENRLERSLDPDLGRIYLTPLWVKLVTNLRLIIQNDLPKLGGTWLSAFFLVGLMVHFRNPAIRRLRYFLLMCLGVFIVAQALGRTNLSVESPELNSENLLALLAPFVIVYGVGLFFLLLDLINLPLFGLRYLIIGAFSVVACLPLILVFLPPKTVPVAYPPYYPPMIQAFAGWLKEYELTMSDVPWAVAWYGNRQSIWLTLKCTPDSRDKSTHENFFEVNDYLKHVAILYLTPQTMDSRFLTQWIKAGEQSWGSFIVDTLVSKKVPSYFPLAKSLQGWLPDQIMLADWERWGISP